jgi:hypothetical protein
VHPLIDLRAADLHFGLSVLHSVGDDQIILAL